MSKVKEIEKVISNLKPRELARFREWFEEFDAVIWDKQFEEDVKSGKVDAMVGNAITDFKKGE